MIVTLEAFSELLEVLYSAPLDQGQWQRFLTLLCQHTESKSGYFMRADTKLGLSVGAFGGAALPDAKEIAAYNNTYAKIDPFRAALLRNPRYGVFQDGDLLPNDGLLQTRMYHELNVPMGLRYATFMSLTLSVRRFEVISLWRGPEQGPMEQERNQLLGLLLPHVQQALQIRQVLGITKQRMADAELLANATSTAAFLLTSRGQLVYSNAAAKLLLADGGTIALKNQCVVAVVPSSHEKLRGLILKANVASCVSSGAVPSLALCLQGKLEDRRLQLLASPLSGSQKDRSGADILLLATDPEMPVVFPDDALRALYNLTSAETEVANGLLMGYSLHEIASLRRVSTGTIRNQVKSVLSKTSTARQSDLIRLLTSLPQSPIASSHGEPN